MELGGEDVVAPAVVAGFGNAEELGEAWHLVAGYPSNQHMSEAGMTALLDQHQDFAIRCSTCNSDPLMFFGPVKASQIPHMREVMDLGVISHKCDIIKCAM